MGIYIERSEKIQTQEKVPVAKRKIRVYHDPVLRRKARVVKQLSGTIQKLVNDLFETMHESKGVGLAAPQVGVSKRVFVIDTGEVGEKLACINPKIVTASKKEQETSSEGCLSLPGIDVEVTRPQGVTLLYTNLQGEEHRIETDGLLARVIQHEFDHLEGTLIIDRAETEQERQQLLEEISSLEAEVHA